MTRTRTSNIPLNSQRQQSSTSLLGVQHQLTRHHKTTVSRRLNRNRTPIRIRHSLHRYLNNTRTGHNPTNRSTHVSIMTRQRRVTLSVSPQVTLTQRMQIQLPNSLDHKRKNHRNRTEGRKGGNRARKHDRANHSRQTGTSARASAVSH